MTRRSEEDAPSHVVGIGASAGGIEALQLLLSRFTLDTTAFVVVMHLLPTKESHLVAILSRATAMSVVTATNGQTVQKNCIYVIPPAFMLTLTDEGRLRLATLPPTVPRWTIDRLFESLSALGRGAAGVILSGNGSDGSRGLQAIRSSGGATFVQDPETARFSEMPRNARPVSDYCLAPEALGDALMAYIEAEVKARSSTGAHSSLR
ncbi:MAG: Chemotaxis protein methyltransferase CheR [Myxococcales bacterium]|nr:Chemotaxis protein methyltransferase CheR [Myxococcales bacterium]